MNFLYNRLKIFLIGIAILSGYFLLWGEGPTPTHAAGATWYESTWSYRKVITVDHTQVGGDFTSFPLLISLTDLDLTKAQASGDDFVFTAADGVTKLDHEIESWNSGTGELVAWVKIPTLFRAADSLLYLYYGNNAAAPQQHKTAVWSDGFGVVQHLNDTSYVDATANMNNGTVGGSPAVAVGKIAGATAFNGSSDYVTIPSSDSLNATSTFTISFWLKGAPGSMLYDGVLGKPNPWWTDNYGFFYADATHLTFFINDYAAGAATAALNPAVWNYVVGTFDGMTVRLYINGTLQATKSYVGSITPNTYPFNIGRLNTNDYNIEGTLDEVRMGSSLHSPELIATEYQNQFAPQAFIHAGIEEADESAMYFTLSGSSTLFAGQSQPVNVELHLGSGALRTTYNGDHDVVFSGASAAPLGLTPLSTDKNNVPIPFGVTTTLMFVNGVASTSLTLYRSGSSTIETSGEVYSTLNNNIDHGLSVHVVSAAPDAFSLVAPATVNVSVPFLVSSTVFDVYGNLATTFLSTTTITVSNGTITPSELASLEYQGSGFALTAFTLDAFSGSGLATLRFQNNTASGTAFLQVVASVASSTPTSSPDVSAPPNIGFSPLSSGVGVSVPQTVPLVFSAPSSSTSSVKEAFVVSSSSAFVQPLPSSTSTRQVVLTKTSTALPQNVSRPSIRPSVSKEKINRPTSTERTFKTLPTISSLRTGRLVSVPNAEPFVDLSSLSRAQWEFFPSDILYARIPDLKQEVILSYDTSVSSLYRNYDADISSDHPLQLVVKNTQVQAIRGYIITSDTPLSLADELEKDVRALAGLGKVELLTSTLDSAAEGQAFQIFSFVYASSSDGIFTAQIQSKNLKAHSRIFSITESNDSSSSQRKVLSLRLTNHPFGLVTGKDHPEKGLSGARVRLYWFNPVHKKFELWNEDNTNKKLYLTNDRGEFFLSPSAGYYYIAISHPGYTSVQSEVFEVSPGKVDTRRFVLTKESFWWDKVSTFFAQHLSKSLVGSTAALL